MNRPSFARTRIYQARAVLEHKIYSAYLLAGASSGIVVGSVSSVVGDRVNIVNDVLNENMRNAIVSTIYLTE